MIERVREAGAAKVIGLLLVACVLFIVIGFSFRFIPADLLPGNRVSYADASESATSTPSQPTAPVFVATHVPTPSAVKGIYMTACVASTPSFRERVIASMKDTEINSLVIDYKDYTCTISYADSKIPEAAGKGCRVADLPAFIERLHKEGTYVIGRMTVFQDPLYAGNHPEVAVASVSRPGQPWKDKNGLAFIDPNFTSYWDRVVAMAKEMHSIGFDEINFDYIRFPSDGNMSDAKFALPASTTKAMVITDFFSYLHSQLEPQGIIMSADIFGQTTINTDDLGIGQILENALPYFDYIMPMVYPSHFIRGFGGFDNPAEHPYEVIKMTMIRAVERAIVASSTPTKLRPWLQDFDLGAKYTPEMVRAQVQATYDAGLTSWIYWNPSNVYNKAAL
jgi:hypothetical protein